MKFWQSRPKSAGRRGRAWGVERLETRELMAADITWPSLTGYIRAAEAGANTGELTIDVMTAALASELTKGPLADLKAGTITPAEFQTNVSSVVTSFDASVDSQLSPRFPNITAILKLQGAKIESQLAALGEQESAGLITSSAETTQAGTAITALTTGSLKPLHSPFSAYSSATKTLEAHLNLLSPALADGAEPSLTVDQVKTIAKADTKAYADSLAASLYLQPATEAIVVSAVGTFDTAVSNLSTDAATAQTELTAAITALDKALLDTTGLFGPSGSLARRLGTV